MLSNPQFQQCIAGGCIGLDSAEGRMEEQQDLPPSRPMTCPVQVIPPSFTSVPPVQGPTGPGSRIDFLHKPEEGTTVKPLPLEACRVQQSGGTKEGSTSASCPIIRANFLHAALYGSCAQWLPPGPGPAVCTYTSADHAKNP